jgi:hypothetical protein
MRADREYSADLITTDVLGPFNAPWATANLGLVPGVVLYFFFGMLSYRFISNSLAYRKKVSSLVPLGLFSLIFTTDSIRTDILSRHSEAIQVLRVLSI